MIELNDVMPPIFLYEMPDLTEKETGKRNGFCQISPLLQGIFPPSWHAGH